MSAEMRLVWLTMSKTLEKLITIVKVRCGDKGWLKPWAILCARGRRGEPWSGSYVEWRKEGES